MRTTMMSAAIAALGTGLWAQDAGQEVASEVAASDLALSPDAIDAIAGEAAQADAAPEVTVQTIEAAAYEGEPLADARSPLTVKVQVLLDRAGISPGVIDGYEGGMSRSAIGSFQRREGLEVTGQLDDAVWTALGGAQAAPIMQVHRIVAEDLADVTGPLPTDYAELAELSFLGYVDGAEAVAERFHMDVDFLRMLNPGAAFAEGEEVSVVAPEAAATGTVARIVIDKPTRRLLALAADGTRITDYPVAIGSEQTPSPSGTYAVKAIAPEPNYTYDPANFRQGDNDEVLILPPGPNGPVGIVWIDLDKPSYGIHGTADPARLFEAQSHGCVRMTNWDALELMGMVDAGVIVEFVE